MAVVFIAAAIFVLEGVGCRGKAPTERTPSRICDMAKEKEWPGPHKHVWKYRQKGNRTLRECRLCGVTGESRPGLAGKMMVGPPEDKMRRGPGECKER